MVICLTFIVADPARCFFRSVDQVLPAMKCRMVSATDAPKHVVVIRHRVVVPPTQTKPGRWEPESVINQRAA